MVRVYCAGKISKNDWRHTLFPGLRTGSYTTWESLLEVEADPPRNDGFIYAGPYFISCDHGCYHGENSHGVGAVEDGCMDRGPYPDYVVAKCTEWLWKSDVMFVWLDHCSAYGTLVEIGMASAMGKPIFLAEPEVRFPDRDSVWFPFYLSGVIAGHYFPGPVSAFDYFMRNYVEMFGRWKGDLK